MFILLTNDFYFNLQTQKIFLELGRYNNNKKMLKFARLSTQINKSTALNAFSLASLSTNLNPNQQIQKFKIKETNLTASKLQIQQIINPLENENFFQTDELVNMEDMFK